jgi:hypothetical protein
MNAINSLPARHLFLSFIRFGPFVRGSCLVILLCGCGSHDSQPNRSRFTNAVLVTPILQEQGEAENRRASDVRTNSPPLFQFEVFSATVPEGELGKLGLQSLFQSAAQTLPAAQRSIAQSSVIGVARGSSNATLELLPPGTHVGQCVPEQMRALLTVIKGCSNASMTGPMKLAIRSGEVGHVTSQAPMNVVIDVNMVPGRTTFVTTNLSFGGTVELAPTWLPDQNRVELLAVAHSEEFRGYRDPGNRVATNTTGQIAVIPLPMFRVGSLAGRTTLATNDAFVLGGPVRTNIHYTTRKVPFLSDLPRFGRLFRRSRAHTNCERSLIIIRQVL